MKPNDKKIEEFQDTIWQHYRKNGRNLTWRNTKNPYRILVSEIMLQQTQVSRVISKYPIFLRAFPNIHVLAKASVADVLTVWKGMGYNRRALALRKIAQIVVKKYNSKIPSDLGVLKSLPGIGKATAGAVSAFAFNKPSVFIETNIRRVFIDFFFKRKREIHDTDIEELVAKTVDEKNPREWYYALMDYGAMLGKSTENPNAKSAHYYKQTLFQGSNRQVRGSAIKLLIEQGPLVVGAIAQRTAQPVKRVLEILAQLKKEGFILQKGSKFQIHDQL